MTLCHTYTFAIMTFVTIIVRNMIIFCNYCDSYIDNSISNWI